MERINKKAQVTIFIILAVVIVAIVILIIFLYQKPDPDSSEKPQENPESFLSICLKDELRTAIKDLGDQGGFSDHHTAITFRFLEEAEAAQIEYLCYQKNYFLPCVNQEPMLFHHIKNELDSLLQDKVESCWRDLGISLDNKGYVVDSTGVRDYSVVLEPGKISVVIDASLVLTKSGETTKEETFRVGLSSNLYELIKITQEIISNEAIYGDFDRVSYMLANEDYSINLFPLEGTKIYTINNRETGERFRFAVRGMVFYPGY